MRPTRRSRKPALRQVRPGFLKVKWTGKHQGREVDMPGVFLYYLDMHIKMEV